eukprot:1807989-Prymnesium_polylepis.1
MSRAKIEARPATLTLEIATESAIRGSGSRAVPSGCSHASIWLAAEGEGLSAWCSRFTSELLRRSTYAGPDGSSAGGHVPSRAVGSSSVLSIAFAAVARARVAAAGSVRVRAVGGSRSSTEKGDRRPQSLPHTDSPSLPTDASSSSM